MAFNVLVLLRFNLLRWLQYPMISSGLLRFPYTKPILGFHNTFSSPEKIFGHPMHGKLPMTFT
jgi:hypothetical protein